MTSVSPAAISVSAAGCFSPDGKDRGAAVLLTAASWVLQRLPGQVIQTQRAELIRTLAAPQNLVVEVECSPTARVRVLRRTATADRDPERPSPLA